MESYRDVQKDVRKLIKLGKRVIQSLFDPYHALRKINWNSFFFVIEKTEAKSPLFFFLIWMNWGNAKQRIIRKKGEIFPYEKGTI